MTSEPKASARTFIPAKPEAWLLNVAQALAAASLALHNRMYIDKRDVEILRNIPKGAGIILTPNHADEIDPRVCMNLSRLCQKLFVFMCNREAFDELGGFAGWGLQRIGVFSVERGGHDAPAKQYSVDVVRQGRDVLVIFPEGEIFYLNDSVQPFHSGAIDIGINAILKERERNPDFTAYIVPMAIKYRYIDPIEPVLEKRVRQMERKLSHDMHGYALRKRLSYLLSEVLQKEELAHHLPCDTERYAKLTDRLTRVKHAILSQVEEKYQGIVAAQSRTIDRAWQLSAHLREMVAEGVDSEKRTEIEHDLADLKEVTHMVSFQPEYAMDEDADDLNRLAEVVLKLEREIYGTKRPEQLGRRNVVVRIGQPVNLADYLPSYKSNPHLLRHELAEKFRAIIQGMINDIDVVAATQR